jgi:hypothetical protein
MVTSMVLIMALETVTITEITKEFLMETSTAITMVRTMVITMDIIMGIDVF